MLRSTFHEDFTELLQSNGLAGQFTVIADASEQLLSIRTRLDVQIASNLTSKAIHGRPSSANHCADDRTAIDNVRNQNVRFITDLEARLGNADPGLLASIALQISHETDSYYTSSQCRQCRGSKEDGCPNCKRSGRTRCDKCSGSGKWSCSHCDGRGDLKCWSCDGVGSKTEWDHTIQDNAWDTMVKNHGVSVTRKCSNCYKGRTTCGACSGRGKGRCSSCDGKGEISCANCSGSGKVKCAGCSGTGAISNVHTGTVSVRTSHHIHEDPQLDPIIRASIARNPSSIFAKSRFSGAEKLRGGTIESQGWSYIAATQIERLNVEIDNNALGSVVRLAGENSTVQSSLPLDEVFYSKAKSSLLALTSLKDFKEGKNDLPGVVRWAFGENALSSQLASLRPMYEGLLSQDGVERIKSLKKGALKVFRRSIRWKFYTFFISTSGLAALGVLSNPNATVDHKSLALIAVAFSPLVAEAMIRMYVYFRTKI